MLQDSSPCIDTGTSLIEIEGEPILDYGADGLPDTGDSGEGNGTLGFFWWSMTDEDSWEEYEDLNGNGVWDAGFSLSISQNDYYGTAPDMGALEWVPNFEPLPGDVNADGNLDILDIVSIVNFVLKFSEYTDEQFDIADVNQDGSLDVIDIVLLLGIILNQ